jgi:general secretion pathway protein H
MNSLDPRSARQAGFTLIEVLIVITIIGILATVLSLKIGNRALDDRMQVEAERFYQLMQLAQEETDVKGVALGLRFTEDGYQFLALNDKGQWTEYGNGVLRTRHLDPAFYTELHVEGRMVPPAQSQQHGGLNDEKNKVQPQILLLPGGETSAFALDLKAQNYPSWFHIESDALGRMREERQYAQ